MLQLETKTPLDLNGYTVIIPSVCVGNAAQLACDLLIASKCLRRVGCIGHSALIPVFGPSAYLHEAEKKSTACELYGDQDDKLLVIQFRSPLIFHLTSNFHFALAEVLRRSRRVVVLSASFGFEKRNIKVSSYYYKSTDAFRKMHKDQLNKVAYKEYTGDVIYGGGNAMQLFEAVERQGIAVMILFRYLLEGDNTLDASSIIRQLNELCEDILQMNSRGPVLEITVPVSWKLLFGNEVTELIF